MTYREDNCDCLWEVLGIYNTFICVSIVRRCPRHSASWFDAASYSFRHQEYDIVDPLADALSQRFNTLD